VNKKRSKGLDFQEGEKVYILRKNIKIIRLLNKLDYIKIGLYKIKRKLGLVTFKMELSTGINIHPVFYKSLLEKAPLNAKLGPVLIYKET
jgi:hypothetical protein